METIIFISGLLIGFFAGQGYRDFRYERLYLSQKERGDYWFERYSEIIKDL